MESKMQTVVKYLGIDKPQLITFSPYIFAFFMTLVSYYVDISETLDLVGYKLGKATIKAKSR